MAKVYLGGNPKASGPGKLSVAFPHPLKDALSSGLCFHSVLLEFTQSFDPSPSGEKDTSSPL